MENRQFNIIMDKQFLDALGPLIFAQNVLLCPQYTVTDRILLPLLPKSYTSSFVGAVILLLMRVYRTTSLIFVDNYLGNDAIVLTNFVCGCFGTICTYMINIIQSANAILILVKLQHALRWINLDAHIALSYHKLWNIVNLAIVFTSYILCTGLLAFANQENHPGASFLVSYVVSAIFDLKVILLTSNVVLAASILAAWNRKLAVILSNGSRSDGKTIEALFSAYATIIKAFNLCKSVYQFGIIFLTFQTFHHVLFSIQILIEFAKSATHDELKIFGLLRSVVYFTWNTKNLAVLIRLCVSCERFYVRVRQAEAICARVVSTNRKSELRRMCKNVLRVTHASLCRMSAYGLFSVNAAFPLRLVGATAAYVVVILQFTLL